ncbi:MAG: hypothetical protein M3R04_10450, partial [bacterium]|nr:hypothetical protein [bacterium]
MADLGFNLSNYAAAMKKRYAPDYVESMVYRDKPFMALVKKMESMGGSTWEQPVAFSDSQARGYTIATAQALADTEYQRIATFAITRVKDFGVAHIDGELIEASKKDEDAFFRGTTEKVDSVHRTVANKAAVQLYRKGWGLVGQVNATVTGTTLTLTNPEDIVNFNVGNILVFSSSEDGATLRDAGDTVEVTSVNRSAGTMVVGTLTGITGLAENDFIFIQGDRQDSATPTRRMIAGLEDWIPQTAPTST